MIKQWFGSHGHLTVPLGKLRCCENPWFRIIDIIQIYSFRYLVLNLGVCPFLSGIPAASSCPWQASVRRNIVIIIKTVIFVHSCWASFLALIVFEKCRGLIHNERLAIFQALTECIFKCVIMAKSTLACEWVSNIPIHIISCKKGSLFWNDLLLNIW